MTPTEVAVRTPETAVAKLLADLTRPEALDLPAGTPIEVRQTHISLVVLTPERAYKVKKPVQLWGLVDYRDRDERRRLCEEEVRLNRRLARRLYLGTVPIVEEGGRYRVWHGPSQPPPHLPVVDTAVVMIRVPDVASWKVRVMDGFLAPWEIDEMARRLADFHKGGRLQGAPAREALPLGFARVLKQNVAGTREGIPEVFPQRLHDGLVTRLARRLARARHRLRQRADEGRVVDGHGDLRLEHIVRHRGRVLAMDCIEFNPRLRHIDPLSDLAFLSMDLVAHGRPDLARRLEQTYLERSADLDGATLLPLFRASRAHVRAKVDLVMSRDPDLDDALRATKLRGAWRSLVLAWRFARTGAPPPLVALHGTSGTGKSVLASAFAPWIGADILRSDLIRKELAGMRPLDRPRPAEIARLYGSDMSAKTYESLHKRAGRALVHGRAMVLDATYLARASRDAARAVASRIGVPFVLVDVRCDPEVIRQRLRERAERGDDASDAGVEVFEQQWASREPLDEDEDAVAHEMGTAPERTALAVAEAIEVQLDPRRETLGAEPRGTAGATS
jgi:aminoglycoside phosphotransferase family enzyme/predicted kinase